MANLPRADRALILEFLYDGLNGKNPRRIGRALVDPFSGFWRYRIGDYRIISALDERRRVVLVVRIGRRSEVYRKGPE